MTISLGLSAANQARFDALLGQSHHIAVSLGILDLNHKHISNPTPSFLGGQVVIDDTAAVTRSASLTFLDPYHKMALDSSSPSDGAMYIDRMMQIYYTVYSTDRSWWASVPVFTGPITKMDRDWAVVRVECMGKEILALDQLWNPKTYRAGARQVDVVKQILMDVGETRFHTYDSTARMAKNLSMSTEHKPWIIARWLSRSVNLQLFYDGRGIAVQRPFPVAPVWTFTDDAGGTILSKPQIGYDSANMINAVEVKGAVPAGMKTPLTYRAMAPVGSPVYPYALGRNNKPRIMSVKIDDDSIGTVEVAKKVADDRLRLGELESVTAAFDILPVPHLQERDPYQISTSEVSTSTTLSKMTIPLVANEDASIGYLKNLKPSPANIRRRK